MDKHFASLTGAFRSARSKAEKVVGDALLKEKLSFALEVGREVTTNLSASAAGALKCVREYDLSARAVASAGPGCLFAIHDGTRKSKTKASLLPGCRVSIWLLDKRALVEGGQYSKEEVEALLVLLRRDAAQMLKLRHPGLLSLMAPLEENRHHLALVTEPVFASVANAIANGANLRERGNWGGQRRGRGRSGRVGCHGHEESPPPPPRSSGETAADAGGVVGPGAEAAAAVEDPLIPYKLATLALSTLEIKHGTLQLASALSFLHRDAGIVHRALSPETVVITAEGRWKIAGGFGHAVSVSSSGGGRGGGGGGDGNGGSTSSGMFSYATPASSVSSTAGPLTQSLPLTPPMAYVAPELVLGADGSGAAGGTNGAVTWAADIFSLGALHYELIAHRRWLEVPDHLQTLGEYRAALASAGVPSAVASSGIGSPQRSPGGALEAAGAVVKYMTAVSPSARPAASALGTAAYFHADPGLHALQSLDTFLELDVLGRAALLQSLQGSWALFDGRVLRYRVLPPLLTELRTPQLQTLVLPLILELAERQDPEDFTGFTLPHLTPLLERATGATLLSILRSTAAFAARITCPEVFEARVLPAVLRGVEAPEVLVQEEALRQVAVVAAAGRVRPKAMCLDVVPLLLAAALNTTAAAVRVNALVALGKVAPGLGPQEWDAALAMLRQLLAVDTSAATLMCVLGVADAVGRAGGAALTAARVLPLVCPLTMAPGLNQQQLGTVMRILHAMLDRVEAVRMPALKSLQPDVGGGGVGGSGASTETSKGYVGQHGSGDGGGEIGAGSSGSSRYGWAIGGVAGEAAVSFPAFARPPTPPGSDPFVSSSSMFVRMTTFAATPAPLAPPPATPLSTSTLGGGWGGGRGGGAISVADQLAAALSSPDDLEALFTEPGYVPVPPTSIPGGGNGGVQAVGDVAGFSLL